MRKIITPPLNDENLGRINENFSELFRRVENAIEQISQQIWNKIVDQNTINLGTPVNNLGDLPPAELPDPDKRNTIRYVRNEQKLYVFNGSDWLEFEEANYDPYQQFKKELDKSVAQYKEDLTSQLNLSKKEIDALNTSIKNNVNNIGASAISTITQLKNDVTSLKTTFETDYANKVKTFNDNVTDKTTTFNNNYTTKLNAFNDNYNNKAKAFNDNYDKKNSDINTFYNNATQTMTDLKNKTEAASASIASKKINGIVEILEGDTYYITKYEDGFAELHFTYDYTAENTKTTSGFYYYDINAIPFPAGISFVKVFSTTVSILGNYYITGGTSKNAIGSDIGVRVWSYKDAAGTTWTLQISVLGKYK